MKGLEAVRRHHLATVKEQAAQIFQDARRRVDEIGARAATDAAALTEAARSEGEAAASIDTDRAWTTARRRARGLILAAQREAYDDLRASVGLAIRRDARYPLLLERLGHAAQRQLGPGAVVEIDSAGDRGVAATRKGRRVAWSLSDIVDACLEDLGPSIVEVWQ
jgi:vacuolar-type H+-ATPase subunit E/Vma4